MPDPVITIGVPTFGRAEMLSDALASVIAQTFADWAVVVSDNGNDPRARELVESFADPRLTYVGQPVNLGAAGNFEYLREHAETSYFAILHDDDLLEPQFVERMLDALGRSETGAWGIANAWVVRLDTRERYACNRLTGPGFVRLPAGRTTMLRLLARRPIVLFSGVVLSRAVAANVRFTSDLRAVGDLQLWLDVAARHDGVYVAEPLVTYRVSKLNDSIGVRMSGTVLAEQLVMYARLEARPELGDDGVAIGRLRARMVRKSCRLILTDPALGERAGHLQELVGVLGDVPGAPAAITRAIVRRRTLTRATARCAVLLKRLRRDLTGRRWNVADDPRNRQS